MWQYNPKSKECWYLRLRAFSIAIFLLVFPGSTTTLHAQTCDFSSPTLLYSQGTPGEEEALLYTTDTNALPTAANQSWPVLETFLRELTDGFPTISASAFDRKSNVLYLGIDDSERSLDRVIAIPLPLETATPVTIWESIDGGGSKSVKSITIDYTNRDRVYFLFADRSNPDASIIAAPRLSLPISFPATSPVASYLGAGFFEEIQHMRSTSQLGDSLQVISVVNDVPRLSAISLDSEGNGSTPVVIDSDLYSSITSPADSRTLESAGFEDGSQDFYFVRSDVFQGQTTRSLMRFSQSNLNNPAVQELDGFLSSTASPAPGCDSVRLAAGTGSDVNSGIVYLYCVPSLSSNLGITSFSKTLELVNPVVSAPSSGFLSDYYPGTISCCGSTFDADTDGDGFKDCADTEPLVALDSDNDGVPDATDGCVFDAASAADQSLSGLQLGCPCVDRFDADVDGLLNCQEPPSTVLIPIGETCFDAADVDKDGTQNCFDLCPNDSNKILPLVCGCEVAESAICKQPCDQGLSDFGCGCGVSDCSIPRSGTILTKFTTIGSPPEVVIGQPTKDSERSITLRFELFAGAAKIRLASSLRLLGEKSTARQRLSVAYDVVVTKIEGNKKRNVLRRTVKANSLLIRKLESGLYTAKYRAVIRSKTPRTGEKRVIGRTKYSPAQTFSF
jgi:hypothetical protein